MPVPADSQRPAFRLLIVPGVIAGKWSSLWSERLPDVDLQLVQAEVAAQAAMLLAQEADAGLVRLPVDRETTDAIPLYTEATVVVVPRDHVITAASDVTVADLAGETLLWPLDDVLAWPGAPGTAAAEHPAPTAAAAEGPATTAPASAVERPATTAAAVDLVAAGVGLLVVPQSLARAHQRRSLAYRVVTDAPTSSVALAWVRDQYTDLVEEMIGIVRGRTVNSTRGRAQVPQASEPAGGPSAAQPARDQSRGAAPRRMSQPGRGGARHGAQTAHTPRRRKGR